MSKPSFSNIDLWLFELAEGNLSPQQIEQLELFLLNHPELDVERDVWEMAKVDKQEIVYPHTADLQKKRRPVGAIVLFGALAVLLSTGLYVTLDTDSKAFTAEDSSQQDAQVKAEVMNQLHALQENSGDHELYKALMNQFALTYADKNQSSSSNEMLYSQLMPTAVQPNGYSSFTNNSPNSTQSRINRSANSTSNGVSQGRGNLEAGLDNAQVYNGQLTNDVALQTSVASTMVESGVSNENGTESVTNPMDLSYADGVNEERGNNEQTEVGLDPIARPSDFKDFENRAWRDRKTISFNNAVASSRESNISFKERFKKFSRSLERMMNSPIALKNSRDPHYHVPGMTANDINFSSAGTLISTRVQTLSRLQWPNKANEQLRNQVSIDGYAYGIRGGWGMQLNHNYYKDGGIQSAQAAFTYSPKISVSNWFSIEPSVRVKIGHKQLKYEQMGDDQAVEIDRGNAYDFYANGASPIGRNLWYKDLGLGVLVNTKWFFAGVQADNLFKHKDNIYDANWNDPHRASNHLVATIGTDWISRNKKTSFSPYLVYQNNDELSEMWAGANFSYNWFNIGVAASNNMEPAASIGMTFDNFSLHYNADYSQSTMLGEKALSHQLTIRFLAKQNNYSNQLFKR